MTRRNPWISKADWTPLPKGEIDVWKFSLALRKNDRNILSQDELERFNRTDSKPTNERKIACRAQLRRILSLYTSTDPSKISFEYGQNQKPLLPRHSDLSFNLSHSENMGLVAVTYSRRVGIDLEYLKTERPFAKIAERFLTKNENDFIGGYTELEQYLKPTFNYNKLKDITKVLVNNLNNIIDYNFYPTEKTKLSNFKHNSVRSF